MSTDFGALGLHDGASITDVQRAYRRLAKEYHPDVVGGDRDRFEIITAAYTRLAKSPDLFRPAANFKPVSLNGRLSDQERARIETPSLFAALTPQDRQEIIHRGYSEMFRRSLSGQSEAEITEALRSLNWPSHLIPSIFAEPPAANSVVGGFASEREAVRPTPAAKDVRGVSERRGAVSRRKGIGSARVVNTLVFVLGYIVAFAFPGRVLGTLVLGAKHQILVGYVISALIAAPFAVALGVVWVSLSRRPGRASRIVSALGVLGCLVVMGTFTFVGVPKP